MSSSSKSQHDISAWFGEQIQQQIQVSRLQFPGFAPPGIAFSERRSRLPAFRKTKTAEKGLPGRFFTRYVREPHRHRGDYGCDCHDYRKFNKCEIYSFSHAFICLLVQYGVLIILDRI